MKTSDLEVTTVISNGKEIKLYRSDLWFIEQIRALKFGTLSNVEIQDGRITFVKEKEKKLKPNLEMAC